MILLLKAFSCSKMFISSCFTFFVTRVSCGAVDKLAVSKINIGNHGCSKLCRSCQNIIQFKMKKRTNQMQQKHCENIYTRNITSTSSKQHRKLKKKFHQSLKILKKTVEVRSFKMTKLGSNVPEFHPAIEVPETTKREEERESQN